MNRLFAILSVLVVVLSLVVSGCDRCEEKVVASLLHPEVSEASLAISLVNYRELNAGISCLDSRFFEIDDNWQQQEVLSDFHSASGSANYGSWVAAGLILRSEAGLLGLQEMGCLDDLPTDAFAIDWSTQAVVVTHVQSSEGCLTSSEATLSTAPNGAPYLNVQLKYAPDGDCEFDFFRTFIVDRPGVRAHLSLVSSCRETDDGPDV